MKRDVLQPQLTHFDGEEGNKDHTPKTVIEFSASAPVIFTVICWPDFCKMTVEMTVEIVRAQNFAKLKFP